MVLVCSCCKSDPRYRVRQHCFHVHSSIHLSLNLTVLLHTPYTPLFQFRGFGSFLIFCVSYVSLQPHLTRHVASPPGAHPPPVTSKKKRWFIRLTVVWILFKIQVVTFTIHLRLPIQVFFQYRHTDVHLDVCRVYFQRGSPRKLDSTLGGTCRSRCRAHIGCTAYAEDNGECFSLHRVDHLCPSECSTCGTCHGVCDGNQCTTGMGHVLVPTDGRSNSFWML